MLLIVKHGPDVGRRVSVNKSDFIIGREPTCDVVLNDARVSRRHLHIWRDGYQWVVRDLGSANGSWINRQKFTGQRPLQAGDQIGLGQTIIAIQASQPEPAARPAPPQPAPIVYPDTPAAPISAPSENLETGALWLDGLVLIAALLLLIGAPLPWVKVEIPEASLFQMPILSAQTVEIAGVKGVGLYTLIGGGIALVLAFIMLMLRLIVRQEEPNSSRARDLNQSASAYAMWGAVGYLIISIGLLALIISELAKYLDQANQEIFMGISVLDAIQQINSWGVIKIDFTPSIGIYLTGAGLLLLLFAAVTQFFMSISEKMRSRF